MFSDLIEKISLNNDMLYYHFKLSPKFLSERSDETIQLLCDFDKLQKVYTNLLTIFKIWYSFDISEILYKNELIIYFNKNIVDLSANFYLVLLIERNIDFVDYELNIEYLKKISYQIEVNRTRIYYKLIMSKILLELIDNYLNSNVNDEHENVDDLKYRAEKNIKENNNIFKDKDILQINIEKIYSMIIISLIQNDMLEEYDQIIHIIKEIELDKIDITKKMFKKIIKFFKNQNHVEDYLIAEERDFENMRKINFYYIMLKYILKNSIFIYNIELFFKTRKFIIEKVKAGYNLCSFIKSNDENINERGEYIIIQLLDVEYYISKLRNNKINKLNKNENLLNIDSRLETHGSSPNIQYEYLPINIDANDNNSIIFSNIIKSTNNSTFDDIKQNLQVSDCLITDLLVSDEANKNIVKLTRKINKNDIATKSEIDYILGFSLGFVCWSKGGYIEIYNRFYENTKEILIKDQILNNIIVEDSKEELSLIVCLQDKIKLFKIKNLKDISQELNFEEQAHNLHGKITFILRMEENKYLICYEQGISYYSTDIFSFFNTPKYTNFSIRNAIGAIKINENYVAVKACNFNNIKENKIIIINLLKLTEYEPELKGFSLLFSHYGLSVMNNSQSLYENKILLCACKKYYKGQKNGILLINLLNSEEQNKKTYIYFKDSEEFEVYCFCPILINNNTELVKKEFNYTETDYFFVGGFDIEKREGSIKLYKIVYDDLFNENKIEYVQDVDSFKGFKSPVSCIIQDKFGGEKKFLVTTLDGNIYLLFQPNLDHYLKLNEEIKSEVTFADFFSDI